MNFYCIADEDTVRGFRLAGIDGQVAATAAEAAAALEEAAAQPACGIIIITGRVAAAIRSRLDAFRIERSRPLIVEIPGPGEPASGRTSLHRLVQEAVGIRIERQEGN